MEAETVLQLARMLMLTLKLLIRGFGGSTPWSQL